MHIQTTTHRIRQPERVYPQDQVSNNALLSMKEFPKFTLTPYSKGGSAIQPTPLTVIGDYGTDDTFSLTVSCFLLFQLHSRK
ncbi:hypothetical protein Fuma_04138 [Fuerstiella marisgermanici]|uniref:Uncharacterized protein n=1 Tax=Fuerstiella marisgermanici TaxID=1891926 RepID=A0A1P8WKD8_9PLAN|nr:hypothetical protein Fuma_04138 [Fuerstiella marisgermanici]